MRKSSVIFLIAAVIAFSISAVFAQDEKKSKNEKLPNTYVSPTAVLEKYHTQEELDKLGKIELTQIYMERIVVLTEVIPYLALHTKPGATLKEMGIPETRANIEHMENAVKSKKLYLEAVKNTLDDVIPYSDKTNIIQSIIFFEKMIKRAMDDTIK